MYAEKFIVRNNCVNVGKD